MHTNGVQHEIQKRDRVVAEVGIVAFAARRSFASTLLGVDGTNSERIITGNENSIKLVGYL